MSVNQVERMARSVDVLQIGARNMQNFDLLKAVGKTTTPVLLKRGLSASLDELLAAAEYVLSEGNPHVILCERGIRTFETATRNTLDLSAVPVLRERTHLPILVDPSHGVGVRRWIRPLARAAKAVGAHGILVEVHPNPPEAKSDAEQALTFDDFAQIMADLDEIPVYSTADDARGRRSRSRTTDASWPAPGQRPAGHRRTAVGRIGPCLLARNREVGAMSCANSAAAASPERPSASVMREASSLVGRKRERAHSARRRGRLGPPSAGPPFNALRQRATPASGFGRYPTQIALNELAAALQHLSARLVVVRDGRAASGRQRPG